MQGASGAVVHVVRRASHCALAARCALFALRTRLRSAQDADVSRATSRRSSSTPACPAIAPAARARFRLTTYDEVRRRATQIAQVTRSRFMPPWKVEPGVGHFVGQRPLTDDGDRADRSLGDERHAGRRSAALPPLPKFADGWLLGKPDLIVKPDAGFTLPAQQTDAFRIFAIRCRSRSGPT